MKRFSIVLLVLFSAIVSLAQMPVPKKPAVSEGLVIDYTNTLSDSQKEQLNRKLIAYDDSTSNQIAVVIISSTGQYPIEDMALAILREWGVGGQEAKDNGIVILVAKDDRRVRIEVGYGLEGAIPDMVAASIIDHQILPAFKSGDYYKGLEDGTDGIIKAAAGEYKAPADYTKRKKKGGSFSSVVIALVILFILMGMFSGGRGGGGGYVSRRGYKGWMGPIFPGGGWTGGGGGGGWSGGGGGGFGGFGGGSGGGGGASGSW
ncbi:MAG TPA: TPM domain-containing protein [Chitinophagaceae bacterium]|nr:TPM domain-containing protein [Chitinophagaceae bacterium]